MGEIASDEVPRKDLNASLHIYSDLAFRTLALAADLEWSLEQCLANRRSLIPAGTTLVGVGIPFYLFWTVWVLVRRRRLRQIQRLEDQLRILRNS